MKAGNEMNRAVAEKFFGIKKIKQHCERCGEWGWWTENGPDAWVPLPYYSESDNDAWRVIKTAQHFSSIEMRWGAAAADNWVITFNDRKLNIYVNGCAKTFSEAVCHAALGYAEMKAKS
jgi:hypothetical protein